MFWQNKRASRPVIATNVFLSNATKSHACMNRHFQVKYCRIIKLKCTDVLFRSTSITRNDLRHGRVPVYLPHIFLSQNPTAPELLINIYIYIYIGSSVKALITKYDINILKFILISILIHIDILKYISGRRR